MSPPTSRAIRWAVAGLGVHLVIVALFLADNDGNPQAFVHFGQQTVVTPLGRKVFGSHLLARFRNGHDGQGFWLLARDPLLRNAEEVRVHLDRPAYRAQRIGYPLLAWPFRAGGEQGLLWGLVIINLAGVALGTFAAARLAIELRAPPRASLGFVLNPGVIAAVLLDASDGLALALLLLALLCLVRERSGWAIGLAAFAVLVKEPSLLALAGVAALQPGLRARARVALVAVPAAVAAGWAVYARARLGAGPGTRELGVPLAGFVRSWHQVWSKGFLADGLIAVMLLAAGGVIVSSWCRRRTLPLNAALPFALMLPFLSMNVMRYDLNSLRVAAPMVTFLALDVAGRRNRIAARAS